MLCEVNLGLFHVDACLKQQTMSLKPVSVTGTHTDHCQCCIQKFGVWKRGGLKLTNKMWGSEVYNEGECPCRPCVYTALIVAPHTQDAC